jgi:hypothetical protein
VEHFRGRESVPTKARLGARLPSGGFDPFDGFGMLTAGGLRAGRLTFGGFDWDASSNRHCEESSLGRDDDAIQLDRHGPQARASR